MKARARRSCLAVPASSKKMIVKAAAAGADQIFLDLEDACAPDEKADARVQIVDSLRSLDFGRTIRAVRVNDVSTQWCVRDILDVVGGAGGFIDALVIPKVENASHVHFVDIMLKGLEHEVEAVRPIRLEIQIESPTAVLNLREISSASDRIDAIIFGPGDYTAALGVAAFDIGMRDGRYPGHQWHWVMSEIAVHARAAGIQAIDGPYVDFTDEEGYREAALFAKLLGFDGKWCIHPKQIGWANETFAPSDDEVSYARRIIDAYDAGLASGRGAIALDGKLVDEASRKLAAQTLARALA